MRRLILLVILLSTLLNGNAQQLFPESFHDTAEIQIISPEELSPIFDLIQQKKAVKVMMIGDSHVRGQIYPNRINKELTNYFKQAGYNAFTFTYYGINGAWARRFYRPDMLERIHNEKPDLLIISFGTNESTSRNISRNYIFKTYDLLTSRIKQQLPNCKIMLTTPPGSHYKVQNGQKQVNGKLVPAYDFYNNTRNDVVAQALIEYAHDNHLAVWDLYHVGGGVNSFCENWKQANMMQNDGVHFKAAGYTLQGKLFSSAFIKAYENYITNSLAQTSTN